MDRRELEEELEWLRIKQNGRSLPGETAINHQLKEQLEEYFTH